MKTSPFDEPRSEVKEHQQRAAVILDGMYQFVALLNPSGKILEVNRAALEGAGHRIQEIRGKPFWTARWWQISDQVPADLQAAIRRAATGEFVRYEVEIYGKQSGLVPITIDFSLQPIRGESVEVEHLLSEGRNITERKQAEEQVARQAQELRILNDRIQELDRLKTQFFADVSHEFRTPLTLMLGPLEDVLANSRGLFQTEAAADLMVAHRNSLRLLKLVNTMLDFSRIEAGRIQASYQPSDLAALTAELASNFRSACERAGLRLIVDCPRLREPVYIDRDMWEKIVLNLLSNALKFTLEGEIAVRLEAFDGAAQLTVRDTGVGIPSTELSRMFERFHRIDNSRGRTHEGTGIGLALVQELVKLHGGAVSVDSILGQGSTFTVRIPFGFAHLDPQHIGQAVELASTGITPSAFIEEALRWLPSADTETETRQETEPAFVPSWRTSESTSFDFQPDDRRARILWADDNADMREYVSRLLGGRFDVQAVADGEAALDAARAHPPDLMLSDVMMPRLNGFSLLRELRADPELREIPIILLSARAGEESHIEGMEAGADDYLIKPFSARELVARVETHVKVSRLRREAGAALRESERRLTTLVSNLPGLAYRCRKDRKWAMEFASAGVTEITGYTAEDFTSGRIRWAQLQDPEDLEWTWEAVRSAGREHRPFRLEYRIRHQDGSERWVWEQGQDVDHGTNEPLAFEGFITDITERKRAEQALAHLAAIVESSNDAIISKDLNGIITTWNRGAEKLFGYPASEVIGRPVTILIPADRTEEEPQILERIRRGERVDHFETIRQRKDGCRIDISLTISPILDKTGNVIGASKIARDITERKRAEELVRQRTAQFETLLNEAPLGVFLVDEDFRIRDVNPTALPAFGEFPDLIGRDFDEVIHLIWLKAYADEIVRLFRRTLETGEPYFTPERIEERRDRGVTEYYEWQINRIPLPEGGHGVVCYFRDISAQVRAREAIEESEARYRSLVSVITDIPWISDAEGRFVIPQSAWAAYTGQNWDESRDFGWANAWHPEDREKIKPLWQYVCEARSTYEAEGRLWHASSQQYRSVEVRATPLVNPDQSIRNWIGACTDVQERKLAEERVRETQAQSLAEEQRSAARLRQLDEAAVGINAAISVEEVLNLTTIRARELVGAHMSVLNLVSDGDWARSRTVSSLSEKYAAWRNCKALVIGEGVYSVIYRDRRPRRLTQAELEAHPEWRAFGDAASQHPPLHGWLAVSLCDQHDECLGIVQLSDKDEGEFTAADEALLVQLAQTASIALTKQQLYEREQSARLVAEEATQAKDEFLAVVSHELRSPLNSILGWNRLLRSQYGHDPYLVQAIETIERAGRAQLRLIEDLLDTARIISGKLRLEVEPVDPAQVIATAIDTIHPAAESKGVVIVPMLDPEVQITGDPERLQQVVWNLISNAVKFTPTGGRVEVELQRGPSDVRIIVRDTGEGIAPNLLPHVFERFKQGDSTASRRSGGLGLGLALVKHLVELHGGTVAVESQGQRFGTTFTVSLPVRAILAKTDKIAMSPPQVTDDRLSGLRILVVDDEADARESVAVAFTMCGATVMQVDSAAAALAAIESSAGDQHFDVVVSDIGMPNEDGYSLMRKVRLLNDEKLRRIPAVALTAYSRSEDRIKALGAGYQMHLAKPVEPDELLVVVASLSGRNA